MDTYGTLSDAPLEMLTHQEKPWRKAHNGVRSGQPSTAVISPESMIDYSRVLAETRERNSLETPDDAERVELARASPNTEPIPDASSAQGSFRYPNLDCSKLSRTDSKFSRAVGAGDVLGV